MKKDRYTKIVEELASKVEANFATLPAVDDEFYLQYLKLKANLQYFSFDTGADDAFDFFKKVRLNQRLSDKDKELSFAINDTKIIGEFPANDKPHIYCTFHLGSYRLFNLILGKKGIDFTLVISSDNIEESGSTYYELHQLLKKECNNNVNFKILNAEDEKIGIQMFKALKRGENLIIYMDGNTGVGGAQRIDEKLVPVDFLGRQILARRGIAFMSHLMNIPIVPVVAYRPQILDRTIEIMPSILPETGINREQYARQATQQLFDLFSEKLLQYPDQWEGWLYVNRFIDTSQFETQTTSNTYSEQVEYTFNQNRYQFFINNMLHYLFDLKTYNCVKVPKALWDFLGKIEKGELNHSYIPELLKKNLINQLINTGILVPKTL